MKPSTEVSVHGHSFHGVRNWLTRRRLLAGFVLSWMLIGLAVLLADRAVTRAGAGRLFTAAREAPRTDVALVLGTSPRFKAAKNPFYEARMDAAAELFRSGAVRGILVSGDNSRKDYDEPTWMKADLVARGVPAEYVTCDYAGFSTLDSIKRAGPVFGQQRVILVSQRFHLERALFLARAAGLDAAGFVAQDAPFQWRLRVRSREALARVKAVADVWLNRQPHFLGKREYVNLASVAPRH